MHKSQLAGFIIDCQTDDIDQATAFWSAALGLNSILILMTCLSGCLRLAQDVVFSNVLAGPTRTGRSAQSTESRFTSLTIASVRKTTG